jgi:hypothetical protein
MRLGHLRGVTLAVALFSTMATAGPAFADGFSYTIPREVLARDLNTGEPYYAPPVPWGHYAKDGLFDHFYSKHCGICGLLMGKGPGHCGGHGLFGHGGKGDGCGKKGCGHCGKGGNGLFHHGSNGCEDPSCGLFNGGHGRRIKDCGLCKGKGCGLCVSSEVGYPLHSLASEQAAPARVVVTPQQTLPIASSQECAEPGCKLGRGHHHGEMSSMGDPCGACKGKGCGLCGGLGRKFGHGGDPCGGCGGKGCGLCGGTGKGHGGKCAACGGKGCRLCSGLKSKLFGLLHPHAGDIKYFVGPGGPVPLTPGYVPYVVPTRSPRDFLAFPPYTPDGF